MLAFSVHLLAMADAIAQDAKPAVALDPDTGLPAAGAFEFPSQPPIAPFWAERLTGYMTTSDGERLRYSVLLPQRARNARVPVILFIHGYDAGSIGGIAYRSGQTAQQLDLDRQLVAAGYAVMGVNPAARGCRRRGRPNRRNCGSRFRRANRETTPCRT